MSRTLCRWCRGDDTRLAGTRALHDDEAREMDRCHFPSWWQRLLRALRDAP